MKAIGLDLDGVIVDWPAYVLSVINKRLGTEYKITDWKDYYGVESFVPEAQLIILEMVHDPVSYLMARPIKGAIRAVRTLSEFAEIRIITCRPEKCQHATEVWLRANQVPYSELTVAQGKKSDMLIGRLPLVAYVDDRIEHAQDVAPYVGTSILFNTSWNQGEYDGLLRKFGWMETLEFLLRRVM